MQTYSSPQWSRSIIVGSAIGIAIGAGLLAGAECGAAENDGTKYDAPFRLLEQAVAEKKIPGVTALVMRRGEVVREAAYGTCDVENGRPFRTDTVCWLASITKPMTVAAAMKLVEEKKLSLDDPVEKYLPEFKNQTTADGRHHPITIRQLMSHTSGIGQRPPLRPGLFFEPEWLGRRLAEVPPAIAAMPLEFKPGERAQYSNAAPYVLGRIVEIVAERPFGEYVREKVFQPLNMQDTFFAIPASHAERMAVVYRVVEGRRETFFRFDPKWTMTMAMPDGGIFSTPRDVAKFMNAFLDENSVPGRVTIHGREPFLTSDSMKQMRTATAPGWGLGWELKADGLFSHDGSSGTSAWADPASGTVGVVFCQIQDKKVTDALQAEFRDAVRAAVQGKRE
jgi:CubicO group peptidase (beta-lactamase class C family)